VAKQLGQDAENILSKRFMEYLKIKDVKAMLKKNLNLDFLAKCLEVNN
jgi:hypothetical protein